MTTHDDELRKRAEDLLPETIYLAAGYAAPAWQAAIQLARDERARVAEEIALEIETRPWVVLEGNDRWLAGHTYARTVAAEIARAHKEGGAR